MLDIDIIGDGELQDSVNPFISSLLPHENYDAGYFAQNLTAVFKYIRLEEFKLEYRLLFKALVALNELKISMKVAPELTRHVFEGLLETSVYDAVMDKSLGVISILQYEGKQTDLGIETVRESACQIVCERCLTLYDLCFGLAQPSATVLNREPELRVAFLAHVSAHSINVQHDIICGELYVGRKRYGGCEDWLSYTSLVATEVRTRLNSAENSASITLDTMDGALALLSNLQKMCIPIAKWGIPQLDDFTPIMKHRLVTVVGNENIGKTKFAIDKAVNVLLSGGRVEYMCGETIKAKVFADIIINYVWKKYELIIRMSHVAAPDECPEDVCKVIHMTIDEIVHAGLLTLRDSFDYASVYEQLVSDYEAHQFDMCVIDHSCALVGTYGDGRLKSMVDKLSFDCKLFRKNYPVCVLITSHPSVVAKDALTHDKMITQSPTRESQNLSTDSDEVFILRESETLRKQNLIKLENYKRRDAGIADTVILQKKFEVSAFIYDENQQSEDTKMELEKQEALQMVEEMFGESGSDTDGDYLE